MSTFPTTYNKREMKIVRKMLSLMKKFGMDFEGYANADTCRQILEAWDQVTCDHFYKPSPLHVEYKEMGQYLAKKHKWHMDMESCMQMMTSHHLAVALVKK